MYKGSNSRALVLLSGGQDSTTCLYWAKLKFDKIHALHIRYGQRHHIETKSAYKIAHLAGADYTLIDIGQFFREIGDSALVAQAGAIGDYHRSSDQLPASFVPGRNIILLTVTAALAYKMDIRHLVGGMCETDYSGYPDCRRETIDSITSTLNLGMDYNFIIHTPLMYLTKKLSVKMAQQLEGCMEAMGWSHTCYEGRVPPCGKCPACELRAKGFEEAGVPDPLLERLGNE
jgi:7-cyano-7-deazaguanine synthase